MLSKNLFKRNFCAFQTTKAIHDTHIKYTVHNYAAPKKVAFERGSGLYLYDIEGNKYVDCFAAATVVNQGHCHPKIRDAMLKQAKQLTLTSRAFYTDKLGLWEKRITEQFGYDKVIFMNGGTEGAETSIKFARRWAYDVKKVEDNKAVVLFPLENYWGRSIAGAASSEDPVRRDNFGPLKGFGFDLVEYNNVSALEEKFKSNPNIAAYVVEPI